MEPTTSLVKWVEPTDVYENDGNYVSRIPVIPLEDLTALVEGLRELYGQVQQAREGFDIYNNSPSMNAAMEEAQRLLTQLEACRKEG